MKKQIAKMLLALIAAILLVLLTLNHFLQVHELEQIERTKSRSTIAQIVDILMTNQQDLQVLTDSLQDEYIIKAQMAAYMLSQLEISTPAEYEELANLLSVDELHIFDSKGLLYTGSMPKYFGYTFDSGEQMAFFLPILEDKTLTLYQDITPNTAEGKSMMYIATWLDDGSEIVQIGIEPSRILDEQRKNSLSYIFSTMPTDADTLLFAIDGESGVITGSSDENYLGWSNHALGLDLTTVDTTGNAFYADIDGETYFCVFDKYMGNYICSAILKDSIYSDVAQTMVTIAFYFTLAAVCLYFTLLKIADVAILRNIELLIQKATKITGGDLDTKVDINTSPEFTELSTHINAMVTSLLSTTSTLSTVLDYVDNLTAVYEYKPDMKRVLATSKLAPLLQVSAEELEHLLEDKNLFQEKIQSIQAQTTQEPNVYLLNGDTYLKIETISTDNGEYGVIVDVTKEIRVKQRLEYERDFDILSNLYNRRAFYREMDALFADPQRMKEGVVLVLDMDNLKVLNDTYGHSGGDAAIRLTASLLKDVPTKHKIISRLGGDEFALCIYGEDSKAALLEHINLLRSRFDNTALESDFNNATVKISAGYAWCSVAPDNYHVLIKYADDALYVVKNHGKNHFMAYDDIKNTTV